MTAKVGVYEEDGTEYDTPIERDLLPLIYKEKLTCLSTYATNSFEVPNTTFVSLGLSITPPAGIYLAFFTGSLLAEGAGSATTKTRIVVGGNVVGGSIRETKNTVIMLLGLIGGNSVNGGASSIIMPVTVAQGQSVDVQCAMGGTGTRTTVGNRSLVLLRIG